MVDRYCDTGATELRDEVGSLLDCLGAVAVGSDCSCSATATCADDRCPSLAQGGSNSTPSTSGSTCHDGYPIAQRVSIWRPAHSLSLLVEAAGGS
jgi:hypothetical protein